MTPELYVALLEKVIAWLSACILLIGGSFSGALVYIYKQGQGTVASSLASMEKRIGDVADSLSKITDRLFQKTDDLNDRVAAQEARTERVEAICQERHGGNHAPTSPTKVCNPWMPEGA
jgi:hypothetical protein